MNPQQSKIQMIVLAGLVLLIIILSYILYTNLHQTKLLGNRIAQLETDVQTLVTDAREKITTINQLEADLRGKDNEIAVQHEQLIQTTQDLRSARIELVAKQREIEHLLTKLNDLEGELGITKTQLQYVTEQYDVAKQYQDRVTQGTDLYAFYPLLADYTDYAQPIILDYLDFASPKPPTTDDELWERGRRVYNWISSNYRYCGDKGIRVGSDMTEFQFYSPDEDLESDNARCGDCDDFATLFAGLMYASGVPYDKTYMVCGSVSTGGHCWDEIVLSNATYRIDPTCSDGSGAVSILGFDLNLKAAYYTSAKRNVDCMFQYHENIKMNPEGNIFIE